MDYINEIFFEAMQRETHRILTFPVNGHFLSTKLPSRACLGVLNPKPTARTYLFELTASPPFFGLYETVG